MGLRVGVRSTDAVRNVADTRRRPGSSVWSDGSEFDQDWDKFLHSYKEQWLRYFRYCIWPGHCIAMSVWYGG